MNSSTAIRDAKAKDASRIAEILVFSKRTHYRQIFQDDAFSFGELQVLSIAQNLLIRPKSLAAYKVYDDGFVKGLILLKGDEIAELYIDPFFERQGIGTELMAYALENILHPRLWVVDGNENAVRFYQKQGFRFTGEQQKVPGTEKTESRMVHTGPITGDLFRKIVRIVVDRPIGSHHPDYPDLVYPVNYGYVEGVPGGDGEDQDAYILGIEEPVSEITGKIAAIIHRENDNEDKWVVAPVGTKIRIVDILRKTAFQEQYFRSSITLI